MRRTLRLLADIKPVRYLEAGTPTGLTGITTHPSPRSTLLYLYVSTLDKLRAAPAHSLYRQSVEAVTKHRMALVEAAKPPGHEAWAEQARRLVAEHPEQFDVSAGVGGGGRSLDGAAATRVERGDSTFVIRKVPARQDQRLEEWDGELDEGPNLEGHRTSEERKDQALLATRKPLDTPEKFEWQPEPQLTAEQISELETKIGAGLIEEVVQQAERELELVDTMTTAKVWESLEEQPVEGQWSYFERKA